MSEMSISRPLAGLRDFALVLIYSSVFLPSFTAGVLTRFGTAQVSLLLLCGGIVVGAVYAAAGGELRRLPTGLSIAAAAFSLAVIVAMLRAEHKLSAYLTGAQWLGQAVMLLLLVALAGESRMRRFLVAGLGGTVFVVAAYSVHQYYVGLPTLRELISSRPELGQQFPEALSQAFERRALLTRRAFGTFITPNSLGGLMLLGLPLSACALWHAIKRRSRTAFVFCLVVTLGVLAALLLSKSKGAWLSALIAAAIFAPVLLWGKAPKAVRAWLCAGIGVVVPALVAAAFLGAGGMHRAYDFMKSFLVRLDYWRGAWGLITRSPIVGNGLESFGSIYPSVKLARAHETLSAHNDYLQIWADAGIVGLAGFVGIWIAALAALRSRGEDGTICSFPRNASVATLAILALGVTVGARTDVLPFLVLWLPAAYVLWAALEHAGPLRIGLGIAIVAYLVHSSVDLNAYVPGVAMPAWAAAAAAFLLGGGAGSRREARRLSRGARIAIVASACVTAGLIGSFEFRSLVGGRRLEVAATRFQEAAQPNERGRRATHETVYYLQKAIDHLPNHDGAYVRLGAAYSLLYQRGEESFGQRVTFNLAVEAYRQAIRLDPNSASHYAALARLYVVGAQAIPSRWKDAVDAWAQAVERYPTNPRYRLNLGRSLRQTSELERAAEELAKALELEREVEHEWLVLSEEERQEAASFLAGAPTR